jgi:thiosulfate dehydrogenase (quinone) large subunit
MRRPRGCACVTSLESYTTRRDAVTAYTVLRLGLGFSIFFHGVQRWVIGIGNFARPEIAAFSHTPGMPHALVPLVVYLIPVVETIAGASILLGLATYWGLLAEGVLMLVLIFGTCMQGAWAVLAMQMPYPIIIFLLLMTSKLNLVSLDALFARSRS